MRMPANNSNQDFQLSFQLFHKDGVKSVFYRSRNIETDFKLIFDLIRYDSLFIQQECKLSLSLDENSCTISIKSFDFPIDKKQNEETQKFIMLAIENKLMQAGLYDHFFISGFTTAPSPHTKTTVYVSYQPEQLTHINVRSRNALELEKLNFPEDAIPESYCCAITREIMDIPYCDMQDEKIIYEQRALVIQLRKNHCKNPFTNIYSQKQRHLYEVWDKIENFMSKIRFIYEQKLNYEKYMKVILDENVSSLELKAIIKENKEFDNTSVAELVTLANNYYEGHEYTNAVFLFNAALAKSNETKIPDTVKLYYVIGALKIKSYDKGVPLCQELIKEDRQPKETAWIVMLIHLANYYMEKNELKQAKQLISNAYALFQNQPKIQSFPHWQTEYALLQQLRILIEMNCPNTYEGRCKALRNIALNNRLDLLQIFFDFIPLYPNVADSNPKKGYTAMHWAVEKNLLECAWMLRIIGATLDVPSASWKDEKNAIQGDETAKDLILKSNSEPLKSLLNNYYSLNIQVQKTLEDKDLTKKIQNSLPLLAQELGLHKDTQLIYINEFKKIVISPGSLSEKVQHEVLEFFITQVRSVPDLNQLFTVNSLIQLKNQKSLLELTKLRFSIKFALQNWQNYQRSSFINQGFGSVSFIRTISTDQTFFNYVKPITDFILRIMHQFGFINQNPNCQIGYKNLNLQEFQIEIDCNFSKDLYKFLKNFINSQLKNLNNNFECKDIIDVNVTQSSNLTNNLIP